MTALNRRLGEQGAPVPRQLFSRVMASEEPEAIYAGPLYVHFGHFLLKQNADRFHGEREGFDGIRIDGLAFVEVMSSFGISKRLRLSGQRGTVYVALRVHGEPTDKAGVAELTVKDVMMRMRWIRPAGLRRALRRHHGIRV